MIYKRFLVWCLCYIKDLMVVSCIIIISFRNLIVWEYVDWGKGLEFNFFLNIIFYLGEKCIFKSKVE